MNFKNTWYKKHALESYDYKGVFPFGDGEFYTSYELTVRVVWFWGLYKSRIKVPYKVSMFSSVSQFEAHWDSLIS